MASFFMQDKTRGVWRADQKRREGVLEREDDVHKEAGANRKKHANIPYWVWKNSRENGIRVSEWFDVEVEVEVEFEL